MKLFKAEPKSADSCDIWEAIPFNRPKMDKIKPVWGLNP